MGVVRVRQVITTDVSIYSIEYLFNTVAKLTKNKTSTGVDISQQHSSNDFMNYFTCKINTIRDQTVNMQLPAAV